MRLGGPVFLDDADPDKWVRVVKDWGYRAALCPVTSETSSSLVNDYREAAHKADIVIAQVGAWSNPISPDPAVRSAALEHCKRQLALAENIQARCCVNISGSRGTQWDGPHPDNFSEETFGMIVDTVREIIDSVKPEHTFFALETMPWIYPDSADSYLALIKAIDRKAFAVHFDPVNMISSPRVYYRNGDMIRDFIRKLGPYIKNAHAKDILLAGRLTVHLSEVLPGTGALDYAALLTGLDQLDPDIPLIIEHLPDEEQYRKAVAYIRDQASQLNIRL